MGVSTNLTIGTFDSHTHNDRDQMLRIPELLAGIAYYVPLNPQTLATDRDKGIRVRPGHIHTALRQFAGIADHPHSRKFPLVIPGKEQLQGLWG